MMQMRLRIIALAVFQAACSQAVSTWCDSCDGLNGHAVSFIDRVDKTKKWLCEPCTDLTTVCYRCGIPVWKGYVTLLVAAINGCTMEIDEECRVPLGGSNVLLRCLAIEPGSVLIERVNSGRQLRLYVARSGETDTD